MVRLKLHVIKSFNESRTFFFFAGGKRNEQLILPLNSSLSVTLDKEEVIDLFTPTVTSSLTWEIRGYWVSKSAIPTRLSNTFGKQQRAKKHCSIKLKSIKLKLIDLIN